MPCRHAPGTDRFGELLREALRARGCGYVRPCHDLRSSITNAAAAGTSPEALMSRAGHSDYAATRRYVELAGERSREEGDRLEQRLSGAIGTKRRYKVEPVLPSGDTGEAATPVVQ